MKLHKILKLRKNYINFCITRKAYTKSYFRVVSNDDWYLELYERESDRWVKSGRLTIDDLVAKDWEIYYDTKILKDAKRNEY